MLELAEFAWHDCYQEAILPADDIDDILTCSEAIWLVEAARLAAEDHRDQRIAADATWAEQA